MTLFAFQISGSWMWLLCQADGRIDSPSSLHGMQGRQPEGRWAEEHPRRSRPSTMVRGVALIVMLGQLSYAVYTNHDFSGTSA